MAVQADEDSLTIASFGPSADQSTVHTWEAVSDPVMGGSSHATFAEKGDHAAFAGEVKTVWFLGSPGFCIAQTAEKQQFPDLTRYDGLSFKMRNMGDLTGIQIMLSTEHSDGRVDSFMSHGTEHGSYVAQITVPNDGSIHDLTLSWSDFSTCQWRGEQLKCPAIETQLAEIEQIGLSFGQAPHKAGRFHIDMHSISAVHMNALPTKSPTAVHRVVDKKACACAGVHSRYGGSSCSDAMFNGRHFCYVEPGVCSDGADLVARYGVAVEGMEWSYAVCKEKTTAVTAASVATAEDAEATTVAEANDVSQDGPTHALPFVFGTLLVGCLGAALIVYKRRVSALTARLDYEMNDVRNVAFGGNTPESPTRDAVAIAVNVPLGAADQAAAMSKPINAAEL
jgi:hypothetical protein